MSVDFWWGFLLGAIVMVILGFALCALLVVILYRYVWVPNAEVEARTYTGGLGQDPFWSQEELDEMLRTTRPDGDG